MVNSARDFAECQAPIPLIVISEHEEILNPLDPIPPRKKTSCRYDRESGITLSASARHGAMKPHVNALHPLARCRAKTRLADSPLPNKYVNSSERPGDEGASSSTDFIAEVCWRG